MSIHDDIMELKNNNHNSVELDSEIDIVHLMSDIDGLVMMHQKLQ